MPSWLADHIVLILAVVAGVALLISIFGLRSILRSIRSLRGGGVTARRVLGLLVAVVFTLVTVGVGIFAGQGLWAIGPADFARRGMLGELAPELSWESFAAVEALAETASAEPTSAEVATTDSTPAESTEPLAPAPPGTEIVSLSALRGEVVLVNFWATWCPPCRQEMPDLERLQQEYGDQGLRIVHISDEQGSRLTAYLQKHPMSTIHGRVDEIPWPLGGRPTSYVVDREGVVRAAWLGARDYDRFVELVRSHL